MIYHLYNTFKNYEDFHLSDEIVKIMDNILVNKISITESNVFIKARDRNIFPYDSDKREYIMLLDINSYDEDKSGIYSMIFEVINDRLIDGSESIINLGYKNLIIKDASYNKDKEEIQFTLNDYEHFSLTMGDILNNWIPGITGPTMRNILNNYEKEITGSSDNISGYKEKPEDSAIYQSEAEFIKQCRETLMKDLYLPANIVNYIFDNDDEYIEDIESGIINKENITDIVNGYKDTINT